MHDKVTRLRQLMSEALPRPAAMAANEDAWRAYQLYESNTTQPLEQTWRDLAVRAVNRISMRYGWPGEIQRFLDNEGVPSISQLTDDQVAKLSHRMKHLEDCVQSGCDSEDAPPAR